MVSHTWTVYLALSYRAVCRIFSLLYCDFLLHPSLLFLANVLFCREYAVPLRMLSPWDTNRSWWNSHPWNFSGPKFPFDHNAQGLLLGTKANLDIVQNYSSLFGWKICFKLSFQFRFFFFLSFLEQLVWGFHFFTVWFDIDFITYLYVSNMLLHCHFEWVRLPKKYHFQVKFLLMFKF